MTRVLIVDDDPIVADSLAALLSAEGYDCDTANDGQAALDRLNELRQRIDVLITDMDMPRCDGRDLLKRVRSGGAGVVPLVLTGFGKIEDAVEAIKLGAANYLTKPVLDDDLKRAVADAVQRRALLAPDDAARSLSNANDVPGLVADDIRTARVLQQARDAAAGETPVLITGEPGAGQSLFARAVHAHSPRHDEPFVTFDCVGLDETGQVAELCGVARGGLPDVTRSRPGVATQARGGTLVIQGLHAATPGLQRRLLELLEHNTVTPLGAKDGRDVDARFIFTADGDLRERVAAGTFREDLFYRVNVVPVHVPPLRHRQDDLPGLAQHVLDRFAERDGRQRRLTDEALAALRAYAWPGNLPEFDAAIAHAATMSPRLRLTADDLPDSVTHGLDAGAKPPPSPHHPDAIPALIDGWTPMPLADALLEPERRILLAALEANEWNRSETARQLGIDRTTLYKKIRKFRLDEPASS